MTAEQALPISGIRLENFRRFESYEVPDLNRVSLLVGDNHSGKTSILEAVELLAGDAGPRALVRLGGRRGSGPVPVGDEYAGAGRVVGHDVAQFFRGRDVSPGRSFRLVAEGRRGSLSVRIAEPDTPPRVRELASAVLAGPYEDVAQAPVLSLTIQRGGRDPVIAPLTADGLLLAPPGQLPDTVSRPATAADRGPIVHLGTGLAASDLRRSWDAVRESGRESEVLSALNILDPTITSVRFPSGEGADAPLSAGRILLEHADGRRTVPLTDHGEGMVRTLALSLRLVEAAGGVLLLDEVDTGLHWSVLGEVWTLIIRAARDFNIQVVATTHSFDCLRGLDQALGSYPDLADDAFIHTIRRHRDSAFRTGAESLGRAIEAGVEIR